MKLLPVFHPFQGRAVLGNSRLYSMKPVGLPMLLISPAIREYSTGRLRLTAQRSAIHTCERDFVVSSGPRKRKETRVRALRMNNKRLISADASRVVLICFKGKHERFVANQSLGLRFL